MKTRTGLSFRPKACGRCGGDAYLSRGAENEWFCLQCGRTVAEPAAVVRLEASGTNAPTAVLSQAREAA